MQVPPSGCERCCGCETSCALTACFLGLLCGVSCELVVWGAVAGSGGAVGGSGGAVRAFGRAGSPARAGAVARPAGRRMGALLRWPAVRGQVCGQEAAPRGRRVAALARAGFAPAVSSFTRLARTTTPLPRTVDGHSAQRVITAQGASLSISQNGEIDAEAIACQRSLRKRSMPRRHLRAERCCVSRSPTLRPWIIRVLRRPTWRGAGARRSLCHLQNGSDNRTPATRASLLRDTGRAFLSQAGPQSGLALLQVSITFSSSRFACSVGTKKATHLGRPRLAWICAPTTTARTSQRGLGGDRTRTSDRDRSSTASAGRPLAPRRCGWC